MSEANLIRRREPLFDQCPSCKNPNSLRRSHSRNIKEKIFSSTNLIKLYRCKQCGWRGYLTSRVFTKNSVKWILFYLLLILGSAAVVYMLLKMIMK